MATSTIKTTTPINGLNFRTFYGGNATATISNGKKLFASRRNPILVWQTNGNGDAQSLFIIFTGVNEGDWTLSVRSIYGASGITASISGDDIVLSGSPLTYGYGVAIGVSA